ncbi:hypothetical protein Lfu02_59970 [Longispora fulva]|uniref:Putative damage-inducible protein DinB n=1 Tax=Longispora fulva TaxID=619741 RepID=A0A8J7GFU1_9ACTN|nr:DinB family protein [Longispora fulva]MBG6137021.1 putative damage-inducible protein DinB [Longispora fulva]GIG61625.1 hypothetical protein Lfu02_59970 [Longispora fulva]
MTNPQQRSDVRPPTVDTDERTTLTAFLDYVRDAVIAKASGVTDEEGRTPGVASGTSLLGLVRHLTAAERFWFAWSHAGEDVEFDLDMRVADGETAEGLLDGYRAAIRRSNEIVAGCADLDKPAARPARPTQPAKSLRWILVHMIEETSRHAGHADILREHLDGSVGR